jgi:hypothetical protein
MYLRPPTRRATALKCVYKPRQIRPARTISYHNEKEPYDPDADQTPRKKYVFGGAIVIGIAAAVLASASKSVRSDSEEVEYKSASPLKHWCY